MRFARRICEGPRRGLGVRAWTHTGSNWAANAVPADHRLSPARRSRARQPWVVIPTNERTDDCAPHGLLLGLTTGRQRGGRGVEHEESMAVTAPPDEARGAGIRLLAEDFDRVSGRAKSTSATSFSRTTSRMTETRSFLTPATARTAEHLDALQELFVEERRREVLDVSQIPRPITAHPARLHRSRKRDHRRPPDRRPLEARDHAQRRACAWSLSALKAYGYQPDPQVVETFTKYRKTHNEAVFDAYTADVAVPQLAHPDRAARRLRSRPDHRRLPPGRALRRRPADRA